MHLHSGHPNPLRDGLAHSYRDELPEPRFSPEPLDYSGWRGVKLAAEVIGGALVLLLIFAAIWLWMAIGVAAS